MNPMTTQRGWSHNSPPNVTRVRARMGPPSSLPRGWGTDSPRATCHCFLSTVSPRPRDASTIHTFLPARAFALIACLLISVTRADGPRPQSPESAAPNQSLTLEPSKPTDGAANEIEADPIRGDLASATTPATSLTRPEDAPIVPTPKRPTRLLGSGPRRSLADALRADAGAAPWYRGGLGATGIVVGLILLLFLCVRRWLPKAAPPDSTTLRVAARVALPPRHSLASSRSGDDSSCSVFPRTRCPAYAIFKTKRRSRNSRRISARVDRFPADSTLSSPPKPKRSQCERSETIGPTERSEPIEATGPSARAQIVRRSSNRNLFSCVIPGSRSRTCGGEFTRSAAAVGMRPAVIHR